MAEGHTGGFRGRRHMRVGCRGKRATKWYNCDRAWLCAVHKVGINVPCYEGEDMEGGEEEGGGRHNGVSIQQCVQCLLPV